MKKRVNSTGRKKINSENIDIRVTTAEGQAHPAFTATIDLSLLPDLDRSARVYVEPYVRSSSMRFDFGTVAEMKAPQDTSLTELDSDESFMFRVRVVDESGTVGRILAAANGIRPRDLGDDLVNRKSLLPLVTKDLGEAIWRVDYDPDSGPVLQISNRISGLSGKLKSDPLLQGAIYPMAFREVLLKLAPEGDGDEDSKWATDWRVFIKELTGIDVGEIDLEDDENDFVDNAVRLFSKKHGFASKASAIEEVIA